MSDFTQLELQSEIWKPVVGFGGYYEVSNLGRVRSVGRADSSGKFRRAKLLTHKNSAERYISISLYVDGVTVNKMIHRMVAEAFIPNPDNLPQVNHKDGDAHNNRADNLEWVTPAENIKHCIDTGLRQKVWKKPVKCLETEKFLIVSHPLLDTSILIQHECLTV